jgi:hypothetical protein
MLIIFNLVNRNRVCDLQTEGNLVNCYHLLTREYLEKSENIENYY